MKNILILSAGRRVELIERFKAARKRLNIEGNIIAVDISKTAPAVHFADKYHIIPRISDEKYIDSIIEVCQNEKIDLIVPTIDTELVKLALNRELIEEKTDAKLLLSNLQVVEICSDKNKTQKFFEENNFGVPNQISDEDIADGNYSFPLFIKPKDGSSSINTFKIENKKQLEFFKEYVKEPILQEFMEGEEFSVDVFCDFECNPVTIVPRVRIATRGGEIAKGRIVKDRDVINDAKRVVESLKPIGHITIQCMKTNQGIKYIEINPRFGGGAPMSIDAGADSCENLYRLLDGEKLEYNENYMENTVFVRFDSSIMLNEDMERIK